MQQPPSRLSTDVEFVEPPPSPLLPPVRPGSAGVAATPTSLGAPPAGQGTPPRVNLLLLVTGSVAAVKLGLLLDELSHEHCRVRLAATQAALHFLHRAQPSRTGIPFKSILTDEREWSTWQHTNDAVMHIELRRWADLVVLVPLDANSLAKIANGLCDNLVTSALRAWEVREKPVIVCPAMNTLMWRHPVTAQHLETLARWYTNSEEGLERFYRSLNDSLSEPAAEKPGPEENNNNSHNNTPTTTNKDGILNNKDMVCSSSVAAAVAPSDSLPSDLPAAMFQLVPPVVKRLACGDFGVGGMASPETIARVISHTMGLIREHKRRDAETGKIPPSSSK